jgi:sentrin-specific protease 1
MYLFRQIDWEKQQVDEGKLNFKDTTLSLFKNANLKSPNGRLSFTKDVKKVLKNRFDVGTHFTDGWDMVQLCQSILACHSVKRPTVASSNTIIERHEEILKVLLSAVFTKRDIAELPKDEQKKELFARKKEMEEYVTALTNRADRIEREYEEFSRQFAITNKKLEEYERGLKEVKGQVKEEKDRNDQQDGRLNEHQDDIDAIKQLLVLMISGQRVPTLETAPELLGKLLMGRHVPTIDAAPAAVDSTPSGQVVLGQLLQEDLTEQDYQVFLNALAKPSKTQLVFNCVWGQDFRSLQSGNWLNDRVLNFFFELLINRSCKHDEIYVRCNLLSSFFYPVLMEQGKFNYGRVRTWTKRFSIFHDSDLVFIPINKGKCHWALLVIDVKNTEIKAYDPMNRPSHKELQAVHEYLKHEHLDKEGYPLPDYWRITDSTNDRHVPRQGNRNDCGVFVCMYGYYLSMGKVLHNGFGDDADVPDNGVTFTQADIYGNIVEHQDFCRAKIGLSILKKEVL